MSGEEMATTPSFGAPTDNARFGDLDYVREALAAAEEELQSRIRDKEDLGVATQLAALKALTAVGRYLKAHGIVTAPLTRVTNDLASIALGASPSEMLRPPKAPGRPPQKASHDLVRGGIAAIIEQRQKSGASRQEACQWVLNHLPPEVMRTLRPKSWKTVNDWLLRWGGDRNGERSAGRLGYLRYREHLELVRRDEADLLHAIRSLSPDLLLTWKFE